MAFAVTTKTTVSEIIKEMYTGEALARLFLLPSTTYTLIRERGAGSMKSKLTANLAKLIVACRESAPGGGGQADSDGTLPAITGNATTHQFTLGMAPLWMRLILSQRVLDSGKPELMANEMNEQVAITADLMMRYINRLLTGAGSGKLASITGEETLVSANKYYIPVDECGAVPIRTKVDIYDVSGTRQAAAVEVIGATRVQGTGSILVQHSTTMSGTMTGGTVRLQNSDTDNNVLSLPELIDDDNATWPNSSITGNVDQTDVTDVMYRAPVLNASGSALPVYEHFENIAMACRMAGRQVPNHSEKVGKEMKKTLNWFLSNPRVATAVDRSLRAFNMYMGATEVDFGLSGTMLHGVPIIPEPDLADGSAVALHMPAWREYTKDFEWADQGGHIFLRVPGYDYSEAAGYTCLQVWCEAPSDQGRIVNVNTDAIVNAHAAISI